MQHPVIVHGQHRTRRQLHPVLRVATRQQRVPLSDRVVPSQQVSRVRIQRSRLTTARPTRRPNGPSHSGRHCSTALARAHRSPHRVAAVGTRLADSAGTIYPLPQQRVQEWESAIKVCMRRDATLLVTRQRRSHLQAT